MDRKSEKKRFSKKSQNTELAVWKEKHDSLDEKYARMKTILKQVCTDLKSETEKTQMLKNKCEKLELELNQKENFLERLQSVSEAMVDEYSSLKAKCEMESEFASEAMKRATKYLQENIILKHKSSMMVQNTLTSAGHMQGLLVSEEEKEKIEEDISEIELLQQAASSLRSEVANLKTELRKEKEKQTALQDDVEIAKKLFEDEMMSHSETKEKLKSIEKSMEQLKRVSELYVVKELEDLQVRYQEESEKVKRISCEIAVVQKENSVLSQQQEILLKSSVPDDRLKDAMKKVEELTTKLEDEIIHHQLDVEELQSKLKESENTGSLKTSLEKLQCVEQCLEQAEQRAYTAERQVESLKHRIQELECSVQRLNAGLPAPPPPPPPPPPPSFNPLKSLITLISSGKKASTLAAIKKEAGGDNQQQKAMSEMINAIKKGTVQLRPTPKASLMEKNDGSSAVGEMKEILNTLKKQKTVPIASPTQSTSPEPISNELLEKLEKRRKISVCSEKLVPSSCLKDLDKTDDQSTIELRVILKNKDVETVLSEHDILQSSSSEDQGNSFEVISPSDSHTEGDSVVCSSDGGADSPYPPVEIRRNIETAGGAEQTANICRGTFLVGPSAETEVAEDVRAPSGSSHQSGASLIPGQNEASLKGESSGGKDDGVTPDSFSDSEDSECDITDDEKSGDDERFQAEVASEISCELNDTQRKSEHEEKIAKSDSPVVSSNECCDLDEERMECGNGNLVTKPEQKNSESACALLPHEDVKVIPEDVDTSNEKCERSQTVSEVDALKSPSAVLHFESNMTGST